MIKKIFVLILIFALIATAVAHENKNDGKDADPHDGDAGKGNDDRDKPHHGGGDDGGDDNDDDSDDGDSSDDNTGDDGSGDGGSDPGDDDGSDTGTGGGSGDTGSGTSSGSSSGSGAKILSFSSVPSGFGGSFGSGDCYRVSVWTKQLNNETLRARALYNLQIIADDYDLTIDEFIQYKCSNTGLTFYPEKISGGGGGSSWIKESVPTGVLSQPIPTPQAKKKINEKPIEQIIIGAAIFIILIIGFSYLYWRFRKPEVK